MASLRVGRERSTGIVTETRDADAASGFFARFGPVPLWTPLEPAEQAWDNVAIERVEFDRSRLGWAALGLLVGAGAGGGIGAGIGLASKGEPAGNESISEDLKPLVGLTIGAVVGALFGAFIGATRQSLVAFEFPDPAAGLARLRRELRPGED